MHARLILLIGGLLTFAATGPGLAQTAPAAASDARRYGPEPWWMHDPIIAAVGRVRLMTPANQAAFGATFQSVQHDLPAATREAAAKVRDLGRALAAYGADKVQVQINFTTRPLYEQYRDRTGTVQENQRSDQIERYQVDATVTVRVLDVSLLERVYATVLAAGPVSTQPVYFMFEPSNETRSDLSRRAVENAVLRGRQAAESAGAHLGPVRLIDPTGRACETDVLVAGAPRSGPDAEISDVVTTASRMSAPAAPPPPPPPPAPGSGMTAEQMQVPLQPPLMTLDDSACVVFSISG